MRTPILVSLLVSGLLHSAGRAQVVLDDFNAPSVNPRVWAVYAPTPASVTQSNGRLKFDLTAIPFEENFASLVPWDGFRGNFDLILDFDSFAPNMVRGQAGIEIYISDLDDPNVNDNGVSIEISATAAGRQFMTYEDTPSRPRASSGCSATPRASAAPSGKRVRATGRSSRPGPTS